MFFQSRYKCVGHLFNACALQYTIKYVGPIWCHLYHYWRAQLKCWDNFVSCSLLCCSCHRQDVYAWTKKAFYLPNPCVCWSEVFTPRVCMVDDRLLDVHTYVPHHLQITHQDAMQCASSMTTETILFLTFSSCMHRRTSLLFNIISGDVIIIWYWLFSMFLRISRLSCPLWIAQTSRPISARRFTWSCIRAIKGDKHKTTQLLTGNRRRLSKARGSSASIVVFPNPVGSCAKTSFPSRIDLAASFCSAFGLR